MCKATSLSRQMVKDVRSSGRAAGRRQCAVVNLEGATLACLLFESNFSKQDRLMVELVRCECAVVFKLGGDNLGNTSTDYSISLREMSFHDHALLFARCAMVAVKRECVCEKVNKQKSTKLYKIL